MCEFCVQHGEGKKWYENMHNYSEEVFLEVNSYEKMGDFLLHFGQRMRDGVDRATKWKRRLPLIYGSFVRPLLSNRQKKSHFGQILPIEDVDHILDEVSSVVRIPCICRKVTTGTQKRCCYAVGLDLTHILKDQPDFYEFDRISREKAREEMHHLDLEGLTHSVWTFQTPFIAAVCNCDQDCMAYKIQYRLDLGKVMWKGEYVAQVNWNLCRGCRRCQKTCIFDALDFDRRQRKCQVDVRKCYGCGTCRATCPEGAISLVDRRTVPLAAKLW